MNAEASLAIIMSATIMDLQLPSFPFLITSFIFVLIVVKMGKRSKSKKSSTLSLPPGPWKLPILGNMHHFMFSQPHQKLRDLAKKYGHLMLIQLGQVSTIVISSPEAAEQVMKTHDVIFAQRPFLLATDIATYGSTDIVFSPLGGYWRQLRKICTAELLSLKSVQSFRSIREEEVSNFISSICSSAGSTINLSKKLFSLTFGITTRAAFGEKLEDQEEFISAIKENFRLAGGFNFADVFPSFKFLETISGLRIKIEKINQKLDRIQERMISEHKSSRATTKSTDEGEQSRDLLEILLNLQKHGNLEFTLSNDNIKAVILDIFTAGTETSSTTVEWAMSEMLKNPSVMEKAQAEVRSVFSTKGKVYETGLHELNYLKLIIKETLRLHPPALLIPRESSKRCEIFGYEIPGKTKVIINSWAIGRDPKYWNEAERFYPERFLDSSIDYKGANFEYIPFGSGRRICPGISFGIANVELPLANLLYHFDWKLPNGGKQEELDMTEAFGLTVRRKNDLYLIPSLYHALTVK